MDRQSSSWTARSAIEPPGRWDRWRSCWRLISRSSPTIAGAEATAATPRRTRSEREVEDIDALIKEAGGSAFVYGISSGAALALEAANRGLAIKRLALYEAPFIVDASHPPIPEDFLRAAQRR